MPTAMVPRRQFTHGVNRDRPVVLRTDGRTARPRIKAKETVCTNELGPWQGDLEDDIPGRVRTRIAHRGSDLELDSGTNTKRKGHRHDEIGRGGRRPERRRRDSGVICRSPDHRRGPGLKQRPPQPGVRRESTWKPLAAAARSWYRPNRTICTKSASAAGFTHSSLTVDVVPGTAVAVRLSRGCGGTGASGVALLLKSEHELLQARTW